MYSYTVVVTIYIYILTLYRYWRPLHYYISVYTTRTISFVAIYTDHVVYIYISCICVNIIAIYGCIGVTIGVNPRSIKSTRSIRNIPGGSRSIWIIWNIVEAKKTKPSLVYSALAYAVCKVTALEPSVHGLICVRYCKCNK